MTELLLRIPEGGSIIVSEHCTARSLELFMDVAEMCIIEELFHKSINDALLEFSDDRSEIRRCPAWRPAVLTGISTRIEMYDISQFISL